MAEEFQELHCHDCGRYVQFRLDFEKDGNHVLKCPNCGHEHCRVIRNGRITGDRWDSRNGLATYRVYGATSTATSTYDSSSAGSYYTYTSWATSTASYGGTGTY